MKRPTVALFHARTGRCLFIAVILALCPLAPVRAASPGTASTLSRSSPAVIDDSATVVLDPAPVMNWRAATPKDRDIAIIGRTRVNVRLATAPLIGKTGKIYMVLPGDAAGSVKIAWRSHGLFLDGQLSPGGRTIVYSGSIREPRMEDVLEVNIEADGTRLDTTQQLRFHFEFETE